MKEIYPKPCLYEEYISEFVFSDKVYFTINKSFSNIGFKELCVKLWKNYTAGKCELILIEKDDVGKNAFFSLSPEIAVDKKETSFDYEITGNENRIDICYSEDTGLIHSFCTLLQLIGPYRRKTNDFAIKSFLVKDKPALKMRGMHLCILKGIPLLLIKKFVVLCAFLKVSHIALESWGGLRFDAMKELGWPDAFNKDDLKDIIDFGKSLGVEFIPFFNHAGHASQSRHKTGKHVILDQAPEYEEWFRPGGWTWNVDHEEVIDLHRNVRAELCELFGDGEFIHIGCDEIADEVGIWADPDIDESDGFVRFLNRTADDIKKNLGRKTMMWGDMFLDKKDFNWPFCGNTNDNLIYNPDNLTKDMYVIDWQYNITEEKDESIKYFLKYVDPSKLILSPWQGREKIRGRVNLAKKYKLYGVLGTTWNAVISDMNDMMYTACCMWEEDDSPYEHDYSYACHAKTMAAQNMRKLMPADGYETAGFTQTELLDVIL